MPRIEKDSLGEKAVPDDALYGIQTLRAVENFPISGLRAHPVLIASYALLKKAAAETNRELGLLDERVADAIVRAAEEVAGGGHREQFVVDVFQAGAGTSTNMNVNEVLANRANERLGGTRGAYAPVHPNDHVNLGQSSNDTYPAALRMAAVELIARLAASLVRLESAFERKGTEFEPIVKAGRTHLQDAMPIGLGQVFHGYARTIGKCRRDLEAARSVLCELNLGGTACGTGINSHPDFPRIAIGKLAGWTGQPFRPADDLVEIMQSMGDVATASGALRRLAIDLGKIGDDLRLLSSGPQTGLAEIRLPAVQPGSSIMPGKVNPSIVECVNMVCFHAIGADAAIAAACGAGNLELNVMMPVIAWELLFALETMRAGCDVLAVRCVEGITADAARCRDYLERGVGGAAILNPVIGYAKAAEIAQEAARTGKTIREVAIARGVVTGQQWDELFDAVRVIRPGIVRPGGGG